ncbi:hypothetical protein QE152_g38773 [Popillia japonica]|uniref:non-specific serine/threonine protein kinase n=1 Tax=Popillia japonica TaxID=7064 RepID=A0AAW1HW15_POPJA
MAGIPCPDVIALKQHVLVLSMVGDNSGAPMLRHAQMHRLKTEIPYEQVMQYMKILYKQCNLIHGNLTDKNILWFDSSCYLINLSRALEPHERNAYHFLFNDCKNICKFFKKLKVPNVVTPEKLFLDITGCNYSNQAALDALQEVKRKNQIIMSSHNKV